jgi:hypothetical protein
MKIDYTQIAIGMALGYLVLPGLLGKQIVPGSEKELGSNVAKK